VKIKIGDTVPFGAYTWRVLTTSETNALLIMENVIGVAGLDISIGGLWKNCESREYLNGEFLGQFSSTEVNSIANTVLQTHYEYSSCDVSENKKYEYETTDKVFILDDREATIYFPCNPDRIATLKNSEEALINIAPLSISGLSTAIVRDWMVDKSRLATGVHTPYRLRNTYTYDDPQKGAWTYIGYVDTNGEINLHYLPKFCNIRPALWLDLKYLYTLDRLSVDAPDTEIPALLKWDEIPTSVTDEYIKKIGGFDYSYDKNMKGYVITGYFGGNEMRIPESIWDIPVVKIGGAPELLKYRTVFDKGKVRGNDLGKILSIDIPDSVLEIGYNAFSGFYGLIEIKIPNSVTKISDSAFSGCWGLTSVTIPSSVKEIGSKAFHDCPKLASVTIPEKVINIAPDAFDDCTELKRTD
jgi:hypothetical protein